MRHGARRSPLPTAPGASVFWLRLHSGKALQQCHFNCNRWNGSTGALSQRGAEAQRRMSRVRSAEDYAAVVSWKEHLFVEGNSWGDRLTSTSPARWKRQAPRRCSAACSTADGAQVRRRLASAPLWESSPVARALRAHVSHDTNMHDKSRTFLRNVTNITQTRPMATVPRGPVDHLDRGPSQTTTGTLDGNLTC